MTDEFRRWKYDAVMAVREIAQAHRREYLTASDFSDLACYLRPPPDDRWWGQAMLEAQDLGYVKCSVMSAKSDSILGRGRRVALWYCV